MSQLVEMLNQMDGWVAKEAQGVVLDVAASGEYGQEWSDALASYIDENGAHQNL